MKIGPLVTIKNNGPDTTFNSGNPYATLSEVPHTLGLSAKMVLGSYISTDLLISHETCGNIFTVQ